MPKMKSNSGAAKRFKRNAAGSYKRAQSHLRHATSLPRKVASASVTSVRCLKYMKTMSVWYVVCCRIRRE